MSSQVDLVVKKISKVFKFHFYHNFSNWTDHLESFEPKKIFRKNFGSSIKFGRFWSIFAYFEAIYIQKWLNLKASGLLRQLCIHFVSLLTEFRRHISSGWRENGLKPPKKCIEIGPFEVDFSP